MTTFLISFVKELMSTINTKLYIAHKDFLASIGCGIASFIGEMKGAYILGIPITLTLIFKALCSSLAVLLASLFAIPLAKKFKTTNKPYEFIVRFYDVYTCEQIAIQLESQGIKTHSKKNSNKLIIDSKNRQESITIETLLDGNYKSLKVHELKEYRKLDKVTKKEK